MSPVEIVLLLLLALFVLEAALQVSPLLLPFPGRDSGVFLYAGSRILNGEALYRDVWDHKPPAIHYINALGLLIGRGSRYGVWSLEFVSLLSAALLGYLLMRRAFGLLPAFLGSLVWLGRLPGLLIGGNLTEEYALPLQFAALCLFVDAERRGHYGWRGYVIGLTAGGAFLLRQSLVGVWLAIALYLALRAGRKRGLRHALNSLRVMLLGAAGPLMLVAVYFARRHALRDLWDAAFSYNVAYCAMAPVSALSTALAGFEMLSALSVLALTGWLVAVCSLLRWRRSLGWRQAPLAVAVLGLAVEVPLSALSGRPYGHYFMAWLPTCSLLIAGMVWSLETHQLPLWSRLCLAGRPLFLGTRLAWSAAAAGVLMLALAALPIARRLQPRAWQAARDPRQEVVEYVRQATDEGATVLMWGAESSVNWASKRTSPSRYAYQYPLYTPGYQDAGMVREFLNDIARQKPSLIIDASSSSPPLPPLSGFAGAKRAQGPPGRGSMVLLPEMDEVFSYIAGHYRAERTFPRLGWVAYRYVGHREGGAEEGRW